LSRRIILNFHGLGEPPSWVEASERPYWVPIAQFEDLLARTARREEIEYTFDDGNRSDLEVAVPRLRRLGRSAGFYVLTGRLDRQGYLSPDDVRALVSEGMGVGLHGRDHLDWRRIDDQRFEAETVDARAQLAAIAGRPITAVSIPFGAYTRRIVARLTDLGYEAILTTDGGACDTRRRIRNRTSIRADMDASEIEDILAGRSSLTANLRRAASTFVRRHVV
jgi:peptidoglycan/xylan/chitin deacetylase (PgdA/CDA1 family)